MKTNEPGEILEPSAPLCQALGIFQQGLDPVIDAGVIDLAVARGGHSVIQRRATSGSDSALAGFGSMCSTMW